MEEKQSTKLPRCVMSSSVLHAVTPGDGDVRIISSSFFKRRSICFPWPLVMARDQSKIKDKLKTIQQVVIGLSVFLSSDSISLVSFNFEFPLLLLAALLLP